MMLRIRNRSAAFIALAALAALGLARSAQATLKPTLQVTIAVIDPSTGLVTATSDSTPKTGPAATNTISFSPNSTEIDTAFVSVLALGGITASGGTHIADNNYLQGLSQFLTSTVDTVQNTNGTKRLVDVVVSAKNFDAQGGGPDNPLNLNLSGFFSGTQAVGNGITATWYADQSNGLSTVTGPVGSAPVLSLAGSQLDGTFSFTSTTGSTSWNHSTTVAYPGGLSTPFSMTLSFQLSLVPNGVMTNRSQALEALPSPEPGTMAMALLAAPLLGLAYRRRRRAKAC